MVVPAMQGADRGGGGGHNDNLIELQICSALSPNSLKHTLSISQTCGKRCTWFNTFFPGSLSWNCLVLHTSYFIAAIISILGYSMCVCVCVCHLFCYFYLQTWRWSYSFMVDTALYIASSRHEPLHDGMSNLFLWHSGNLSRAGRDLLREWLVSSDTYAIDLFFTLLLSLLLLSLYLLLDYCIANKIYTFSILFLILKSILLDGIYLL